MTTIKGGSSVGVGVGSSSAGSSILGLAALGMLFAAGAVLLRGVGVALSAFGGDITGEAVRMLVLSGFAGALAAVAGVIVRELIRIRSALLKSTVSSTFTAALADTQVDAAFWTRVGLGAVIGWIVGAWLAAAGYTSVPELARGIYTLANLIPAAGGGFGGGPPPSSMWGVIWLIVLALIAAPLAGAISGWLLGIVLAGTAGAVKGATKAGVDRAFGGDSAIKASAATGFVVGITLAILQAIYTAIAVARFR